MMVLIGIIANKKCFEAIKSEITKKDNQMNVIHITLKSLENMKNIKFDTIIIENDLEKYQDYKEQLKKICKEASYVIINTDINFEYKEIETQNLITFGINQDANVTISSNSEENILIYWQKSINNKAGNKIEIEERRIKKDQNNDLKIDELLILYSILRIYNISIIDTI